MFTLDQKQVDNATISMLLAAGVAPEDTGITTDKRYRDQVVAFVLALNKNIEREQTYDGLWRSYGLEDCAANARMKAQRLQHHASNIENDKGSQYALKYHDDATDDSLDLINYGAFCARLVHESAVENGLVM